MRHSPLVDCKNVISDAVNCKQHDSYSVDENHSPFLNENSIAEPERARQQAAGERK